MPYIRHHQQEQGIGDETADIVAQSLRSGTASCHQTYISKWVNFRCERNSDQMYKNKYVNNDLSFLHLLFQSVADYSVFNTARSSLSSVTDTTLGQHPTITLFMRGMFNIWPALSKYKYPWDNGITITHVFKVDHSNLKSLLKKLTALLILSSVQCCREILCFAH